MSSETVHDGLYRSASASYGIEWKTCGKTNLEDILFHLAYEFCGAVYPVKHVAAWRAYFVIVQNEVICPSL